MEDIRGKGGVSGHGTSGPKRARRSPGTGTHTARSPYTPTAPAVAHVVLEAIEDRLPGLQLPQGDGLITAHTYRGAHENHHAPPTVAAMSANTPTVATIMKMQVR